MIRQWALPAVFWLAIEDGASLSAEVPPGPKWLQTAVFYQIYPQSYYDSNGDGIGDLPGITAKLDYIYSIGCNAIWLNPIFESPFGDAGYDVADFYKVAARYGTNEDFKYLCFNSPLSTGLTATRTGISGHLPPRTLRARNHMPARTVGPNGTYPTSFHFNRP